MNLDKNFYFIKSNDEIFESLIQERNKVGHYNAPYEDYSFISRVVNKQDFDEIIVIGTGGSSLGAKAIFEFLNPSGFFSKSLVFLETVDPLNIKASLKNSNLKKCFFCFVSKSGKTFETLSILKYINGIEQITDKNSCVITTKGSGLFNFAVQRNLNVFFINKNLSGRFSVFSMAGLVPLVLAGLDYEKLLDGAKYTIESFFSKGEIYYKVFEKARFLVENKTRFNINIIFSYSSQLESFNKWYIQLWAESLGKKNVNQTRQGLTPLGILGPVDQHSFLQLIMDGVRDKTITFIKIEDHSCDINIPYSNSDDLKDLGWRDIEGLSFNSLLNHQADSTIEAILEEKDIPCDVITIPKIDEFNIARLMTFYQLVVSTIGKFIQIDTYNQPGVEKGKKNLIKNLKIYD